MLMCLGDIVFELRNVPLDSWETSSSWRHAANSRVGQRPALQFVGAGDETMSLRATMYPEFLGDTNSLQLLLYMADSGQAWTLLRGGADGHVHMGSYVIEAMRQTASVLTDTGEPLKIEFDISLKKVDDDRASTEDEDDIESGGLAGMGGGNLPGLPSLPNVPGLSLPGLPKLPGLSGLAKIPGLAGILSSIPGLSKIPGLTNMLSSIPGLSKLPGLGNIPGLSSIPGLSKIPGLSGLSNLPSLSGLAGGLMSKIPGLSSIPGLSTLLKIQGLAGKIHGLSSLGGLTSKLPKIPNISDLKKKAEEWWS